MDNLNFFVQIKFKWKRKKKHEWKCDCPEVVKKTFDK